MLLLLSFYLLFFVEWILAFCVCTQNTAISFGWHGTVSVYSHHKYNQLFTYHNIYVTLRMKLTYRPHSYCYCMRMKMYHNILCWIEILLRNSIGLFIRNSIFSCHMDMNCSTGNTWVILITFPFFLFAMMLFQKNGILGYFSVLFQLFQLWKLNSAIKSVILMNSH